MSAQQPTDPPDRDTVPRELPADLLAPTYQNLLRSIGRDLDLQDCRSIVVMQVDGGFIVRMVQRSSRDVGLLQFPDDTFPERMIRATEARGSGERGRGPTEVAPTGYEDLLRAVGRWLDERNAAHIVIAEGPAALMVTGDALHPEAPTEIIDVRLDLTEIKELLDVSFRLRGGNLYDPGGS